MSGQSPKFFADGKYGGTDAALAAARAWRDAHWNGRNRVGGAAAASAKLTLLQRAEIGASREPAADLAARYGISRQYVYDLRSRSRRK